MDRPVNINKQTDYKPKDVQRDTDTDTNKQTNILKDPFF
jgi:hypothetical protein